MYKIVLLIALSLMTSSAFASGAPWYKWQNTVDKTVMCSQIRPNEVWVVYQGPFMESNCRKAGYPQ